MKLKTARKILCILFSVLIAVGSCLFTGAVLVKSTLCSEKYMTNFFSSGSVEQGNKNNLENELKVLAAQSNIPVRVFEAAQRLDDSDTASAVKRLFENHDPSLYNKAKIELFENLCKEYLDGNHIKYDDAQIHRTAVRATEIFANSYGFQNTQTVTSFIKTVNENYSKYTSLGLMLIMVSVISVFLLFSQRKNALPVIISGFMSAGFAYVLIAVCSILFAVGKNPALYPQIYADALASSVRCLFIILLVIGIAVSAACAAALSSIEKMRH